jgi:hypothetical protein
MRDKRRGKHGVNIISGWLARFSQFVVDLAKATPLIPILRASLRQRVWLCLLAATVFAQYCPYRFDHWTTDDGLPQNTVTSLVQTRDGYLWLTTFDGLARFDGVRFTVFDKNNSSGINPNRFANLYEAGAGSLLIASEDAGLIVYRNGTFTNYTTAAGLPSNQVLEQLREIPEASAEVIDEVKEIAHNLRPYQFNRLGLTKTIEGMIRKVAETHDTRFACPN